MIRFKIGVNFRRRISIRVIVVSAKESRGIRITLNVVRGTQIFNEILYKNSHLSLKGIIKCLKSIIKKIKLSVKNEKDFFKKLIMFWNIRVNF